MAWKIYGERKDASGVSVEVCNAEADTDAQMKAEADRIRQIPEVGDVTIVKDGVQFARMWREGDKWNGRRS